MCMQTRQYNYRPLSLPPSHHETQTNYHTMVRTVPYKVQAQLIKDRYTCIIIGLPPSLPLHPLTIRQNVFKLFLSSDHHGFIRLQQQCIPDP